MCVFFVTFLLSFCLSVFLSFFLSFCYLHILQSPFSPPPPRSMDLTWVRLVAVGVSSLFLLILSASSMVSPIWRTPALFKTHHNISFIHFLYDSEQHFLYDPTVAPVTNVSTHWQVPFPPLVPRSLSVITLHVFESSQHIVCSVISCCPLRTKTEGHDALVGWFYTDHLKNRSIYTESLVALCDRILWCEQDYVFAQCTFIP